jgi:uncharacterized protein YjlB
MSITETAKKVAQRLRGRSRASEKEIIGLVRPRKANKFDFKDDGIIPNHPRWPLIIYKGVVRLPASYDPAAVFEDLFENNGWGDSWRDGVYDYVHYHSQIHEVLGIARGTGKVQFGGLRGRTISLKAGDVAILPAGTGHQQISASKDFLVVARTLRQESTTFAPAVKIMHEHLRLFPRYPVLERILYSARKVPW